MNQAILLGNVGRDPEIRKTNDGTSVATLSLATSEHWTDKASGAKKEKTEWHRVVAFGAVCDVIAKHVRKGSKLLVTGRIQTRKYVDQSGQDRYITEVVLDKLHFAGEREHFANQPEQQNGKPARSRATRGQSDLDDEIPFQ